MPDQYIPYIPSDWYWIVAGDESKAYSSLQQGFVENYPVERTTRIASMDELIEVLRTANVPPYHSVSSYRIVRRLEAAGLSASALAVLDDPENAVLKARFYTLGMIPANDEDAIALVTAAGGNPSEILAPDV